jgi:hypothetical protein
VPYVPLATPLRMLDARSDIGNPWPVPGTGDTPDHSPGATDLMLSQVDGLPTVLSAAVLNITVTQDRAGGYLTALSPVDGFAGPWKGSSTLNWAAGQAIANLDIVPGYYDVEFLNNSSQYIQVVADLSGNFPR